MNNKEFLQAIFGDDLSAVFTCDQRFRYISYQQLNPNHSNYYAICTVTNSTRKNDNFIALKVLVCDDVGTKAEVPVKDNQPFNPSYIIETSPGNFQYGYILSERCFDQDRAKSLIAGLVKSGYTDAAAHGIVRLVRLPSGVNGKNEADKKDFNMNLVHWAPETKYSYDELASVFCPKDKTKDSKGKPSYEIPTHIPNGSRNTEMTKLCGYLFSTNASLEEVSAKMAVYNSTICETPLDQDELSTIINSIYNRHTEKYSHIINNIYHIQSTGTWFDFGIMTDIPTLSLNTSHLREFSGKKGCKPRLSEWLPKQEGFNEAVGLSWSPVPYGSTERTITLNGQRHINTWQGFGVEPKTGDVEPWLTHLAHVVPEENYREALLWWIAYTIQCPDKRTSWQPIILGVSGAGKDALFRPIATILGSAFKTIGNKDIQGDYDDGLFQTKLLHISEASGLRGASIDFYKRITAAESSDMQMLNIKCKGKVMQHNLCNVLVITNNIDAMKFTRDERRAFVLRSPNVMTEEQQSAYFDNWLDNDGASYLFNYLLRYSLAKFKPGVRPFRTTHFDELLNVTQSDQEIKIEELLEPYEVALPDLIRSALGPDGDKYGTTKILKWLSDNDWVRWNNGIESRRIKRKINGEHCKPKSNSWHVKKGSQFENSTPADMCREVERVEQEFMKKHKF